MATLDSRRGRDFDRAAPVVHRGGRPLPGLVAGLYAGFIMAVMLCILAVGRGLPFLQPFRVIASVVRGPPALLGGAGMTALGIFTHAVLSGALGALFFRVVGPTTMRRLLGLGLFYGILIWIVGQFVVLPFVNPVAAIQFGTVWTFFIAHVGYGVALASALPTIHDVDAQPTEKPVIPATGTWQARVR